MTLEQFTAKAWAQIRKANIWLVIGAILALVALKATHEIRQIEVEGELQRAKQRRETAKALNMTTEELERQMAAQSQE